MVKKLLFKNSKKLSNHFNNKQKFDIIIIDKLKEESTIIKILKKNSKKTISIDYIGNNGNKIDVNIENLYQKMGYSSKSFAGLQYTILNNNFKKRKLITKNVSSILGS